jgi:hypothetical protein
MSAEDVSSGLEKVCFMLVNVTKATVILPLIMEQRVKEIFC